MEEIVSEKEMWSIHHTRVFIRLIDTSNKMATKLTQSLNVTTLDSREIYRRVRNP